MPESETPVSAVKWKNPPPQRAKRYDWEKIATRLRRKPGEWALVFSQDLSSIAGAIRQGNVRALTPSKGFEVRTANNVRETPRRCDLYLRYNPDKDEEN